MPAAWLQMHKKAGFLPGPASSSRAIAACFQRLPENAA